MNISDYIDHTLLKPAATIQQITQLCAEAAEYNFASVCINSTHMALAARLLASANVQVCTVVGFPLGANVTSVKVFETEQAIRDGATEIDMVINIGALKDGNHSQVEQDIAAVVNAAHAQNAICKVIIETALLTDDEKVAVCKLAQSAGAEYVKTSTGFSSGGATPEDVALMRQTVGPDMGIKAAGGVRSLADAQKMIAAGATRLGASAGIKIVTEALAQ